MLKLGSLFDGIGGFPLAGAYTGKIVPVWAAEIEKFPAAVTAERIPGMKQYGDVTKINGAEIEPVDIITFGSPCQDVSVAGLRKGMQHEGNGDEETTRSGLFFEAIRIIKEMREATNGRYPQYAVYENVTGAFSSNAGADFRGVLQALCDCKEGAIDVPMPKKWSDAGLVESESFSLAWRVLDAQYFGCTVYDGDRGNVLLQGTPQRRRRIYAVADFRGLSASQILFNAKGLPRHTEPSSEARESIARSLAESIGETGE